MRIGFITGEFPPMQGGVGDYTLRLGEALSAKGHEVAILTSTRACEATAPLEVDAIIRRWTPDAVLSVRAWAKRCAFDVISLQFQTAAFGMSPWIHLLPDALGPGAVVTTFHDLRVPYLFPKAGRLRAWFVHHLARRSNGVIVTNPEDQRALGALPNLELIPIGSNISPTIPDASQRDGLRQAWDAQGAFVIGFFGLLNRTKGFETLLHALEILEGSNIHFRLIVIGGTPGASDRSNASYADALQAMIAQSPVHTSVRFTGFLDDDGVSAALAACDVVALPFQDGASYRRGSLMAALACGCAIITTEPRVTTEGFEHGKNMLLVPTGQPTALANALMLLMSDPVLTGRLRAGARALSEQFSWSHIAKRHERFFRQIIKQAQ